MASASLLCSMCFVRLCELLPGQLHPTAWTQGRQPAAGCWRLQTQARNTIKDQTPWMILCLWSEERGWIWPLSVRLWRERQRNQTKGHSVQVWWKKDKRLEKNMEVFFVLSQIVASLQIISSLLYDAVKVYFSIWLVQHFFSSYQTGMRMERWIDNDKGGGVKGGQIFLASVERD